ncbi:MAG: VanZ family protein [Pirellulaceae bacterium]
MRQIITTTILGMRLASIILIPYWVVLFIGTHTPSLRMPSFSNADKFYHFAAYAGLAFLMAWALPKHKHFATRHLKVALLICLFYGAFDEITQLLVQGRQADILDFVADLVGAVVGLAAYWVIRKRIRIQSIHVQAPMLDGSRKLSDAGAR